MSHLPQVWKPEKRPQDCWDWITPEDVCRHALAAFYLARDAMRQPPGRRFVEPDGMPWSTREVFGDNLAAVFELRIKTDGYHLGIEPDWANDAKQLQVWTQPRTWLPDELQHPEVSTKSLGSGVWGPAPMERSATDPELSQAKTHIGCLDAAAAVRLPLRPAAP